MKNYLAISWQGVDPLVIIECLRYAGLAGVSEVCMMGNLALYRCPKGLIQKTWFAQNIARMATFGVMAKVVRAKV